MFPLLGEKRYDLKFTSLNIGEAAALSFWLWEAQEVLEASIRAQLCLFWQRQQRHLPSLSPGACSLQEEVLTSFNS